MTYGTAPLAAVLLAVLGYIATGLGHVSPAFHTNKVDLALYFNGASYFVSALTVYTLRQIGKRERSGVDLGPVDRQGDLGGLALHQAHAGRARPGDRDAGRVLRGRAW